MQAHLSLCLALALTSAAHAQAPENLSPDSEETQAAERDGEARGLFEAGEAAMNSGRHEEALRYFERSYELSGRVALLYNVGHAAQLAGQLQTALTAFERYLEQAAGEAERRSATEERVRRIRARLEEEEEEEEERASERARTASGNSELAEPIAETPTEPPGPSRPLAMALTLTGLGIAAGGAVSLGLAASSASRVNDAGVGTPWVEPQADYDATRRRRIAGIALTGAGAALGAVGAVLWIRSDAPVDVALTTEGLLVRGAF